MGEMHKFEQTIWRLRFSSLPQKSLLFKDVGTSKLTGGLSQQAVCDVTADLSQEGIDWSSSKRESRKE